MSFFDRIAGYMPALLDGAGITLALTAIAVTTGLFIGLLLALGRISHNFIIDKICSFYIWFFRGTPLLMQLYFIYFALPQINPAFNIQDRFIAAYVAFALNSGAYLAEIFRAAILSIDKGQFEAAKALGMGYGMTMRRIIIPQSYRRLIPPVGNEFIMVLKDTALVSMIGLTDLSRITSQISTRNGDVLIYLPAMVLYLLMTTIFTFVFNKLEKKYSRYE